MNGGENCAGILIIVLLEITLSEGFKKLGPPHGIKNGIVWHLSGCIELIILLFHHLPEVDVGTGSKIVHFNLGFDQGDVVVGPLLILVMQIQGKEGLLEFMVGLPGVYPDFSQLKGIAHHENVGRILLSAQGIRDHMDGAFMTHMAEQDGIVGPHNEREHASLVGGGTASFIQDNNIHSGKRPVLQIPHHS